MTELTDRPTIENLPQSIKAGMQAVEQLLAFSPRIERGEIRRAFYAATQTWFGDVRENWWRWISDTAKTVEVSTKVIDCTVAEALELAREGAILVGYTHQPAEEWFVIDGHPGRYMQVWRSTSPGMKQAVSLRNVAQLLQKMSAGSQIRVVLVDPHCNRVLEGEQPKNVHPMDRLRRLLKPEWSDIWIVLVFAFVVGLLMLATPIAVESLVNTVAFGRYLQPVFILALLLFAFLSFSAAMKALQTYVVEIIQRRLFARVAADLAYRLPRTHMEGEQKTYLPEHVNRFFDIVMVQKLTAQLLLDGLGIILSAAIGMAVLAFYHPWLLGFDLILLALIAIIIFVLGRGAIQTSIKESKNKYYMAAWLEDIARNPVAFRLTGGTELAMERSDRLIHNYLESRINHFRIVMRQILFALGLQALGSTVLLGMGGWLVISGELTLGQLVAAELIVTVIVGAFAKLGKHMEAFYDLLASVDKLGSLFDLPTEKSHGMIKAKHNFPAEVEFHNVSYSIAGKKSVLNQFSARIPAGRSIAIYGRSGTGKSILLDFLFGLRTPASGHITIDGWDPRDLRPDVLREHVTLARGVEVFQGTVEENVHLLRREISAGTVRDVLENVGLLDSILKFSNGYDTHLSSNGFPLTENQCRLLGLARAVVSKPNLLLVDGVLDHLPDEDFETVFGFLSNPNQPWTLVIATGRRQIAERCYGQIEL